MVSFSCLCLYLKKKLIMSFKNRNDYSIIAFTVENELILKWHSVHNLYNSKKKLIELYSQFGYMNVYNKRTKQFLKRYYKEEYTPPKPRIF